MEECIPCRRLEALFSSTQAHRGARSDGPFVDYVYDLPTTPPPVVPDAPYQVDYDSLVFSLEELTTEGGGTGAALQDTSVQYFEEFVAVVADVGPADSRVVESLDLGRAGSYRMVRDLHA